MSLLDNKSTRGMCQGFTGSSGTFHSEQAISSMPKVSGVTPDKLRQVHQ